MPPLPSYTKFVETPITGNLNDPNWTPPDHPIFKDSRESGLVPLKLYQEKYEAYLSYFKSNRCVMVNLEYLQNNPSEFLNVISSKFGINKRSDFFKPVEKHTKTKKEFKPQGVDEGEKERHPMLLEYKNLEDDINKLTYLINIPEMNLEKKVNVSVKSLVKSDVFEDIFSFDYCYKSSTFPKLPINNSDIILLSKSKNEEILMPSFIEHYKKLGITTLILLDNSSDDKTIDIARQKCGEESNNRIKFFVFKSEGGILEWEGKWFERLSLEYLVGRWCCVADVDEVSYRLLRSLSCRNLGVENIN